MKILILTQLYVRDQQWDEMLDEHLSEFGHEVFRASITGNKEVLRSRAAILQYEPDVVVMPEAMSEYVCDLAQACKGMGVKVVIRRCESGYTDDDSFTAEEKHAWCGRWPYQDYVDLELVWCDYFADKLVEGGYMPREKLKVIGAPFADVCLNADAYGLSKLGLCAKYDLDPQKPIALWATGFSYADRDPNFSIPEVEHGSGIHQHYYKNSCEGRELWLKAIADIYPKVKDKWNFILKLHPGEFANAYLKLGIPVISSESSVEILKHCRLLIHAGSTMAIEAHLLNIPAVQLYDVNGEGNLFSAISPKWCSYDTNFQNVFLAFSPIPLGSNAHQSDIDRIEHDLLGSFDGGSSNRAACWINQLRPNVKKNWPHRWPDSDRNYETEGVTKWLKFAYGVRDGCQCAVCLNHFFLQPQINIAKCPWCGVMTDRRIKL